MWLAVPTLIAFHLLGGVIAETAGIPVPGPVIGILLLFLLLTLRGGAWEGLEKVSGALLRHLSLFFVPSAVGLILYGSLLRDNAPALILAVGVSTPVAMAVAAMVYRALDRRQGP
ncbi:MAG: hypothetical protein A2516_09680 [Alphaproteobacteria bacterium RIFOXYD12_FULL_60_8]|nr:MAG: hypothetical protein A2516_09680 [Alphaproteobacteria bacterium RIFOXYD12_FULL_60_8]